jgi:HlyD family secretion protein
MHKRIRIVLLVLLVLVVVGAGAWYLLTDRDETGPLTLHGNVDIREVNLGFRVPGRLDAMLREEGDSVAAGDELARLDDAPYRDSVRAALARVGIAEARVALFRSGSRPQEIERAEANVREASAALRNAEQELERQRSLDERGLTSASTVDQAEARRDEAAARLRAAEEALALAREGFRDEEIAAAEAELELSRAEAARAETELADTRLAAPSDGTIITRIREPGSILAAGEPVYTLSLDEPVWIRAYIEEPDLGKIAPGASAYVETDSNMRRYRGRVGFISPRAEFTPKNVETRDARADLVYRVRIIIDDSDSGLRQGMPVTVVFDAGGAAASQD